jgi:hypothetical protein
MALGLNDFDVGKSITRAIGSRVGIKKPTQKNPPKKNKQKPPKKTH